MVLSLPSFPRFSRRKKKEPKLANDFSSPGSVNVPKHSVLVMDGLEEFTTELLEWVLDNISASGHHITLIVFMPWLSIPQSLKLQDVWMLDIDHLSLINENDAKYLKLRAALDLCEKHGVTLHKEIVMGYPLPLLLVERIISLRASWVVFNSDRYLRKNRAYFAKRIPYNMIMRSEEGDMDMIKGRPMIDNGEHTAPSESPVWLPTPLVIYSEPLKQILEDQELEKDNAD